MKVGSSHARLARTFVSLVATLVTAATAGWAQQGIAPAEFHAGDRIALTVEGTSLAASATQGPYVVADTVVVREGQILRFPTIGDISLAGVSRANLQKYLTQQFGKFVRDPVVHATPLVRIAMLGQIGRPGFYSFPSDIPLGEVVMRAGGPTGESDLNKTVVKRGSQTVISQGEVTHAFTAGETLDDLRIAPGDKIVIGEKSHFGFGSVLQVLGVTVSLVGLLLAISRR
ncbi:MAG: polysaccharide biosynthesis/export family protein [Gemmatimonadaceae bacterium]